MGTRRVSSIGLMALLLVGFMAGCGEERGVVTPALTSISPTGAAQGQTVSVTLTGTSFTTGATINTGGALITVSNTNVTSSTQITATFAIAANAVLGAANISVTSSGMTTSSVTFTIGPPLAVSSVTPVNLSTGVPTDATVYGSIQSGIELCDDYLIERDRQGAEWICRNRSARLLRLGRDLYPGGRPRH